MTAAPLAVNVRPEATSDRAAIAEVLAAAFESEVHPALVDRIRTSPEYLAELALVAVVDDEVVGHVMISGALLRSTAGDRAIAMLSPLAVRPDRQGQGVGSTLVARATEAAECGASRWSYSKEVRPTTAVLDSSPRSAMASACRCPSGRRRKPGN